jgi:hypothetical protein
MAKTKTTGFFFKTTPEEMAWIERRMAQTNINNKSAFLRKMAIDGHVINLDVPTLTEIGKLLRISANNLNQLTKRVNSGGQAYREDLTHLDAQLTTIRKSFGDVLTSLSELESGKPGRNKFIMPPTIRDLPEYNQTITSETEGG